MHDRSTLPSPFTPHLFCFHTSLGLQRLERVVGGGAAVAESRNNECVVEGVRVVEGGGGRKKQLFLIHTLENQQKHERVHWDDVRLQPCLPVPPLPVGVSPFCREILGFPRKPTQVIQTATHATLADACEPSHSEVVVPV